MAQGKAEKTKRKSPKNGLAAIWNLSAVVMLLGTCCVSSYVLLIIFNPHLPINPFPPMMTATHTPTFTPTQRIFPATWTPTSTFQPFSFGTPHSTATLHIKPSETPRATLTSLPPTTTPDQPARTLPPGMFFSLEGTMAAIPSSTKNPDSGCNWLGVGGIVTDRGGNALPGMTLVLNGILGFNTYNQTTMSGAATQYGPGGYEFYLGGELMASRESLFIQILGDADQPVSDPIYFDTFSDCQRNLTLINFRQIQ